MVDPSGPRPKSAQAQNPSQATTTLVPPTQMTCRKTGEPCQPAPPPAAPSTRDSATSTSPPRTPTNSLHQVDRPASQANPTGTRRGDSVITDVMVTLFSCCVSTGQKHQYNTGGAAVVHPDDELPTQRRTHEKTKKKVDFHFMHDSPTWHQRTGVKSFSRPPFY